LVGIDVRRKIATRSVPEIVLEEAENLGGLSTWLAGGVELLSKQSPLSQSFVLVRKREEGGAVHFFPEVIAALKVNIVRMVAWTLRHWVIDGALT
jgi:hypothetical protein